MEKKLETVKVYSPIYDPDIKKNIAGSKIWKECYREEDERPEHLSMNIYTIKFDGLVPVQVTKIKKA